MVAFVGKSRVFANFFSTTRVFEKKTLNKVDLSNFLVVGLAVYRDKGGNGTDDGN